jgi:periplasmic protein TonB
MSTLLLEEAKSNAKHGEVTLDLGREKCGPLPPKPTQESTEYKKHSLAARNWGGIGQSERPLRQVAAKEAQEIFMRGLLDMPLASDHRKPTDWIISLVVHVIVVGALVIVPLAFTQVLDMSNLRATYLTMPKPPAAAPAPRPPAAPERRVIRVIRPAVLTMPTVIPRTIAQIKDADIPDVGLGVAGGIPGGESDGVLGGILGGTHGPVVPPPAPKKGVFRVGGIVKAPREISRVAPIYSPIARTAHVEGVVVISAIIDENGDVVQAHVVSGPGLLVASALEAVMKWKYEPTYLDGEPVSISMEVTVTFRLHAAD